MGVSDYPRCRHNSGVECNQAGSKCESCGWNPNKGRKAYKTADDIVSNQIGYEIASLRDIWSKTRGAIVLNTRPSVTAARLKDIEEGLAAPISISEFKALVVAMDVSADRLLGLE